MTHRPWLNILIVGGLLALPLALGQGPAAQAASKAAILYVQPGASGGCTSWEDACELQTALNSAVPDDEVWVAQGIYKPTNGNLYESCQAIREADPTALDGDYLIQNGGNVFQVYCHDMAGTPKEYISLDASENYSQYTAGGAGSGTDVRTNYSKVRLLPDTLQVDISDQTFAFLSGSLQQGSTVVTSMPYSVAMDCIAWDSQNGVAHIDLRGRSFAIDQDETFILGGYHPGGSATFTDNRQVVSPQGGGFCGWIQPNPYIYTPVNNAGGPILELEHILPERRAAFRLKSGVAIYGGFDPDSGADTFEERDWTENVTVLSGDIDGNDITDPNGVVTDTVNIHGANAYHVVTGSEVDLTAILDGFIITAGNSAGQGGGMYNTGSSNPTITNVVFSGNSAGQGGGMYNDYSDPALTNVTFSGNSAEIGGGMYNMSSQFSTSGITFISNTAVISGGGMFNMYSSPTLTDATFTGNSASYGGGGMDNNESSPRLTNVTFSGNSAASGGGMHNEESSPRLTNVTFSGNDADWGGGMFNNLYSWPALINVTFSGNSADIGGGMVNEYSSPTLINVTFSGNTAVTSGGGMFNSLVSRPTMNNVTFTGNSAGGGGGMFNTHSSSPILTNAILWGNTAPTGAQIHNNDSESNPVVTYSDIQGGYAGTGNIDADPYFVNAAGGNLRLKPGSPAIDAGDNGAVPPGVVTDLDGKPRFVNVASVPDTGNGLPPIVDMGAYEAMNVLYLPLVKR